MGKFRYLKKEKIGQVPKTPGVYALNTGRQILYIGKAANLRERIKNHFQKSSYRDNLFIDQVTRVGWLETQSDIDALLLESQLIKSHQPKYNVMWKDDKGYFYVVITKEKFPRVFLTHQPQNQRGSAAIIGPFVDGKAIKQVLRLLRRVFPYYALRRGSGQAAKKHPQLPCPWCHLGLCPGPRPNPKEYKRNIRNLVAVLQGKKTSVLKNLKREMGTASREQRFEEAGKLRDQVFALENVMSHALHILSSPSPIIQPWRQYRGIENELKKLVHTKKHISRIEAYDISNTQGHQATGSMVTFLQGKPAKEWYRKFKIHPVIRRGAPLNDGAHPNDYAMIEQVISRRLNHPEWPYPDLMVIDGGKPQLSAALLALRKYKIQDTKHKIHVVALAKKHNELFLSGRKTSIFLKNLPQEVSNLLLHIRDEAHRFAITYHRKLRKIDVIGTP